MLRNCLVGLCLLTFVFSLMIPAACAQHSSGPALPYSPSLDATSLDRTVDPCVDLYQFSCGGWQKKNPIPADQTGWSVYAKMYEDNLAFLRGMLEEAEKPDAQRNAVTQKIGDFYGACMDESAVEKRGAAPIKAQMEAIAAIQSLKDLTPVLARLQFTYFRYSYTSSMMFSAGSNQDPDDSEQVIADVDQGGLGMPDRDYYLKDDAKSKETREHYLLHVQNVFQLIGEKPEAAKRDAETLMRLETAMAKASMSRVDRRNPHNLVHKMKVADLAALAPNFDWATYYRADEVSRDFDSERGLSGFPQGSQPAAEQRVHRHLEDVPAVPRGGHGSPVSFYAIRAGELLVLPAVSARSERDAAALEALRGVCGPRPWRGARAGLRG